MVDLGIPGLGDAEFVGRGGFGQVYKSRQEALNRTVAVKVLRMHEATDAELGLFERECAAIGSLAWCPEIVSVYDSGTTPSGDPYMVMEYAPGGSLRDQLLDRGTLGEDEVREVATHMARALSAAHGAGLIHRDVKPANILISHAGTPVLADFGIAKVLARTGNTSTAAMSGTIAYLAPELLQDQPATPASDIFSLGATLFEALTGHTPFSSGEKDTAASLMRRALQDHEVDVSGVQVSDEFKQILGQCLAIDPTQRFASGAELLTALGSTTHASVQEDTIVRPVRVASRDIEPPPQDATVIRPRLSNTAPPPPPPPPVTTPQVGFPAGPLVVASGKPRPPNTALLAVIIGLSALLLIAAVSVATLMLTRSGDGDAASSDTASRDAVLVDDADLDGGDAASTPTDEATDMRKCWDGALVESGTQCSTDYNRSAIDWVFAVDYGTYECTVPRAADLASDYGATNSWWVACFLPGSTSKNDRQFNFAIHSDPSSRDTIIRQKYGACRAYNVAKGTLLCDSKVNYNRKLVRYESDDALFYASIPTRNMGRVKPLLRSMRSLDDVLYGVPVR